MNDPRPPADARPVAPAPLSPRARALALAWAVAVLAAYVAARAHLLDGLFGR